MRTVVLRAAFRPPVVRRAVVKFMPGETLGPQARLIVTYALCGFANFGSPGILVGGLGAMVPERRREITELGLRSIVSGTIATCTSGAIAGLLSR